MIIMIVIPIWIEWYIAGLEYGYDIQILSPIPIQNSSLGGRSQKLIRSSPKCYHNY